MARVTVEDCLKNVKNRFELVILAAKRARQLMHGREPTVEWDNDKPTVVALREIAAGHTDFSRQEQQRNELFDTESSVVVTTTSISIETDTPPPFSSEDKVNDQ